MFAGNKVAPGKYSLFTIPGESEWTIILNKDFRASVPQYKKEEEGRFATKKPEWAEKYKVISEFNSSVN